jgi:hypothetical protein
MRKARIVIAPAAAVLCLAILMVSVAAGGPKIYWHFTFKAFVHMPDQSAVEWAWVTMVEYDKARAFASDAATAREYGGELKGTVFACVQGAAWRSAHRYNTDGICHGQPATKTINWAESDSDSVYCGGQFFAPRPAIDAAGRLTPLPDQFRLVFTTRRILHEDGRWEDLKSRAQVFVGAINVEGRTAEETKGRFHLQAVNYRDNLVHHKICDKAWAEQYLTAFRHFSNQALEDDIPAVGGNAWGQISFGHEDKNYFVWEVHRLTTRDHPHWKQKVM